MSKKKIKISITDWIKEQESSKEQSPEDALLTKVFEGNELSNEENEKWKRYKYVIDLRYQGYNTTKVIALMCEQFNISDRMAYVIYRDANKIFGKISLTDKQAEKAVYATRLEEIGNLAMKLALGIEGDAIDLDMEKLRDNVSLNKEDMYSMLSLAKDCIKEAAKVKGLGDAHENKDVLVLPEIYITSDPEAAKEHSRG